MRRSASSLAPRRLNPVRWAIIVNGSRLDRRPGGHINGPAALTSCGWLCFAFWASSETLTLARSSRHAAERYPEPKRSGRGWKFPPPPPLPNFIPFLFCLTHVCFLLWLSGHRTHTKQASNLRSASFLRRRSVRQIRRQQHRMRRRRARCKIEKLDL